jgi:hypothetical protein
MLTQYNNSDKSLILQTNPLTLESTDIFTIKDLSSSESTYFKEWLYEEYAVTSNKDEFNYLRSSAFNSFFANSRVDTPRCLLEC